MWIFTTAGFYSAVAHRDNPDLLMIRARERQSLDTMVEGIELVGAALREDGVEIDNVEDIKIYSMDNSDYRWRCVVSKATFAVWVQHEIMSYINYTNYKSELTKVRGESWHRATLRVWGAMQSVGDGVQAWGTVGAGGAHIPRKDWPKFSGEIPEAGAVGSTFFYGEGEGEEGIDGDWVYNAERDEWDAPGQEAFEGSEEWEAEPWAMEFATDEEWEAYLAAHGGEIPDNWLTETEAIEAIEAAKREEAAEEETEMTKERLLAIPPAPRGSEDAPF